MLTNLGRLPGVFTTGESQLPGDEYTGESITNSNNSSNIRKISKTFLGVSNGTRRRCLMKKNRVKKSHDTVSLMSGSYPSPINYMTVFETSTH